jgi:putative heme-binding domain-containing protein
MATATDDWEDLASHSVLSRHDGYARAAQSAASSRPNRQQIAFMFALRNATEGWTPELRRTFFSWFPRARTWKGGNSFKGFIENIRQEALARFVPEKEIAALEELSGKVVGGDIPNFVAPKGPGRAWSIDEVVTLTAGGFKKRDFANGEAMFRSTMCLTCHRFNGDGGGIGPDITGAANRYTMRDLMENIVEPSKVVSDQYDSQLIEKKDGTSLLGRIVVEEDGKLLVMTNPFAPNDLVSVRRNEVTSIKTQPVSLMPPGLINALNQDELLDLLAYIMTGGNPDDPAFQ